MTVIAMSKFRPHAGKANLVLQNMKDVASEFDKMGMSEKYQAMVGAGTAPGELHRAWMFIPA